MPIDRNGCFVPDYMVLYYRERLEWSRSLLRAAWPFRHKGNDARFLIRCRLKELRIAKLKLYGEEENGNV